MNRTLKSLFLLALLAGIGLGVRRLSLGHESAGVPFISDGGARIFLRAAVIALGIGAWFTSQSLVSSRESRDGAIGDAVHEWTRPLNAWLARDHRAANALLTISTAFIDIFGLFLLGSALFGPSVRPGVGLLILLAFRQVAQGLCALPTPASMIWRKPRFPALFVTYRVANDFFFSGHTAVATLGAIELAHVAPAWIAAIGALIAVGEGLTVLILRAHYTMDVLTAAVAAFVAANLAATVCVGF